RRCLEPEASAGIEPELALLKSSGAIPCLGAVKEQQPVYGEEWEVQRVEQRNRCEMPGDLSIYQNEVRSHRTVSIWSIPGCGVGSQRIDCARIKAEHKIVFYRQRAAGGAAFNRPVNVCATVFRYGEAVVQLSYAARETRAADQPRPG